MRTVVEQLGAVGLVADKEPTSLPPNAWTDLSNARCVDRSIASFKGYESIATLTSPPETMQVVKTANGVTYITYASGSQIFYVDGASDVSIGSGYSSANTWDSCILGGVAVFTNGNDNPQYWGGSGNTVDLPYDETGTETCTWLDADLRAKLIKSFRYHLFAMDIEDCEGKNPRKVWWSHPAEPGSVPITWDPNATQVNGVAYDAGFTELTDTPGPIIDALPLFDALVVYKSDAIHSITYTGDKSADRFIWNFRLVTTTRGLYSRDCVVDFGGKHFFVADGDIYIFDGTNFQSIADERVKNLFFNNVSRTQRDKTFAIYYERTQEVWLCYPEEGQTACTKALVWDSIENVWSQRTIPSCNAGVFSVVERSSGYTYGGYTSGVDTYADDETTATNTIPATYGAFIDDNPFNDSLILAGEKTYEMDRTNQADGVNQTCYAQRTHLDLGDKADWHCVLRIYPRATGGAFRVRVGEVNVSGGPVTWGDYQDFTPGTDYKLDFRVTGRQHAIEFNSTGDVEWTVESYEVDYVQAGRR